MPTPTTTPCLVGCTTATVGTGTYVLTADALPPPFSHPFFVLVDGQTITGTVSDGSAYEHGIYTFHSAGGTYGSLTRTLITSSSTAPNATRTTNPISWGAAGVRNFYSDVPETGFMLAANNGSDIANVTSFRNNISLGSAATLNVGTGANQIPQLTAAAKYPAIDGSLITNLPIPSPSVPSGAVTVWYQAAAPSGWTRITTYDDCMISITNSTGFGGGGPYAAGTFVPGSWDASSGMSVGGHAITIAEMPSHSHGSPGGGGSGFIVNSGSSLVGITTGSLWGVYSNTGSSGLDNTHTHPLSSALTWRPPSLKMLLAFKI